MLLILEVDRCIKRQAHTDTHRWVRGRQLQVAQKQKKELKEHGKGCDWLYIVSGCAGWEHQLLWSHAKDKKIHEKGQQGCFKSSTVQINAPTIYKSGGGGLHGATSGKISEVSTWTKNKQFYHLNLEYELLE